MAWSYDASDLDTATSSYILFILQIYEKKVE